MQTKLTAEEFFEQYSEGSRVELINGEVCKMPASDFSHQEVVGNLYFKLRLHLEGQQTGKLAFAPVDVVLSEETVLQPDLVYVSDVSKIQKRIIGVPDLVVEVVSPLSLKRDFNDKMKLYERHGVKEYWLVFPLEKTVLVFTLTQEGYKVFSYATEKGKIKSEVLQGFELDVEEVFRGL